MSESMPERRDLQSLISDIRVDVATIKERTEAQGKTLLEVKDKLELGVFREEYERRHEDLKVQIAAATTEAQTARDDALRQQGASRVWRIVFTAALAILGAAEAALHH